MIDEQDNDYINSGFISECCGAPIYGEVFGDPLIGVCSRCGEWSGAVKEGEDE